MSQIRDLGTPTTTLLPQPPQSATDSNRTAASARTSETRAVADLPSDTATRVSVADTRAYNTDNIVGLPALPTTKLGEAECRGATAFANQLQSIDGAVQNSDDLTAAYLKLQIEDQGRGNENELLANYARHTMLAAAALDSKQSVLNQALALRSQAESLDNQATAIVDNAGVDKDLAESCYDRAQAAGKSDGEALAMYQYERGKALGLNMDQGQSQNRFGFGGSGEDSEARAQLNREVAALRDAAPVAEEADATNTRAGLWEAKYEAGQGAVASVRAGTVGMQSVLKNAEAQQQIANDIVAMLTGKGSTKEAKEAFIEVDKHRNEVARLVLDLVDKHQATHKTQMRNGLR